MILPKEIPYPVLVTDCSSPGVCVGILDESGWSAYSKWDGDTVADLFKGVKQVLQLSGFKLEELGGFAYCEGPGSTMGIRINAMAIRTWNQIFKNPKPVYAYRSLAAAALMVRRSLRGTGSFSVLSDLRKGAWNGLKCETEPVQESIAVVNTRDLETWPRPIYFVQQRIHSPSHPDQSVRLDYDIESIGASQEFAGLWRWVVKPDVFQTTKTEFKKWTPSRHR
ncbi:MAG: hypothetical protein KJT03_18350 [Verrucomicrobiae bacterium]|nr:hypothetical protein [Verrucomicrobiae bacterium]